MRTKPMLPSLAFGGLLLGGVASAADLVVDAAGALSPYATIEAAMVASSPGDRILVLPGSYPAFHFSRGVSVIGMGPDPASVRIARVDYHPNVPPFGYQTLLSNVLVCGSGAADAVSISGNELTHGTLTLHGVQTCGGVFLRGDEGFSVLVSDSSVLPGAGDGFLGAAFDFAGGSLDVVGSAVVGWDASVSELTPAGVALRVGADVTLTLTAATLLGGDGDGDDPSLADGGDGLVGAAGANGVRMVLAGGALVAGGGGAADGAGGDGVALLGALLLGDADVQGGSGAPDGLPFALDPATALGFDPELRVSPSASFGSGPIGLHPGQVVSATLDSGLSTPVALGFSLGVAPSTGPIGTLLGEPMTLLFASSASFVVPSAGGTLPGLHVYAQGFFLDPATLEVGTTNPVAIRMDL